MTTKVIPLLAKVIPLLVLVLASSGLFSAGAEATANAGYTAVEKAANDAEAAVASLRAAMQRADAAYAEASKAAKTKRQQATDAKTLAGEPGRIVHREWTIRRPGDRRRNVCCQ